MICTFLLNFKVVEANIGGQKSHGLICFRGHDGQPLKSVLLAAPGAVDGSKFVFNVNHNNDHNAAAAADYNAAMSRCKNTTSLLNF